MYCVECGIDCWSLPKSVDANLAYTRQWPHLSTSHIPRISLQLHAAALCQCLVARVRCSTHLQIQKRKYPISTKNRTKNSREENAKRSAQLLRGESAIVIWRAANVSAKCNLSNHRICTSRRKISHWLLRRSPLSLFLLATTAKLMIRQQRPVSPTINIWSRAAAAASGLDSWCNGISYRQQYRDHTQNAQECEPRIRLCLCFAKNLCKMFSCIWAIKEKGMAIFFAFLYSILVLKLPRNSLLTT